jgi:hypothetical protein
MSATTDVKFAYVSCVKWSAGGALAWAKGTTANEPWHCRPHGPRPDTLKNTVVARLLVDTNSTKELPSGTTQRWRKSNCACLSSRLLVGVENTNVLHLQVYCPECAGKIRRPHWCTGCSADSSWRLTGLSVESHSTCRLAANCRLRSIQMRSKRRVDSGQVQSSLAAMPRRFWRIIFANLQLASTAAQPSHHLSRDESGPTSGQLSRNNS